MAKNQTQPQPHFVEWDVKIEDGKVKKLAVSRQVVKITEAEAETLNVGILDGGNSYAKMYFPAEKAEGSDEASGKPKGKGGKKAVEPAEGSDDLQ